MSISKIDRDALLFPIAIAGRVKTALFASRSFIARWMYRTRQWRRLAEIGGWVEVLGPFHGVNMGMGVGDAKR